MYTYVGYWDKNQFKYYLSRFYLLNWKHRPSYNLYYLWRKKVFDLEQNNFNILDFCILKIMVWNKWNSIFYTSKSELDGRLKYISHAEARLSSKSDIGQRNMYVGILGWICVCSCTETPISQLCPNKWHTVYDANGHSSQLTRNYFKMIQKKPKINYFEFIKYWFRSNNGSGFAFL